MSIFLEFALTLVAAFCASLSIFATVRQFPNARSFRLGEPAANAILLLLVVVWVTIFGTLALLRHDSLHSWYDLAVYDQTVWNLLHGRLFQDTIQYDNPNFLGFHFSPILAALVPLYAVWANARTMLIAQTILLAVTAFPLYWYARSQLGNMLGLVIVFAFLASPALQYINLDEFHEIAIATPLLAFATFFLLRRRYIPFLVSVALLLLVKEEVAIIVAAFGVFLFLFQRKYLLGGFLVVLGVAAFVVITSYVIPFFSGRGYPIVGYIYGSLGNSLPELLSTIVTHPDKVWATVWTPEKIAFVFHLFVPLVFIPLAGLEVAFLSFPTFAYLLIADAGPRTEITFHYTAPILPFLFFAAVVGLRRLRTWLPGKRVALARDVALAGLLIVASLLSYYLYAPGPLAREFDPSIYVMDARALAGRSLVGLVPPDAIVVSQKEHLSQFSDRARIYDFPSIPDYRETDYLFAELGRFWYDFHKGSWDRWFSSGYFDIVGEEDNFILARRKEPANLQIRFGDHLFLSGSSMWPYGVLRGGMTLSPILSWQVEQPISERYSVALQVVDTAGHLWAEEDREPDNGYAPTNEWKVGRSVGDQYALVLPPTLPTGEYQITVGVHPVDDGNYLQAFSPSGDPLGTDVAIATVRIEKNKDSFTASQLLSKLELEQPYFVDMSELRLLGSKPTPKQVTTGDTMHVGIYWRAREKPRGDYLVAVQLLDVSGHIAFEQKDRPVAGTYPTTEWDIGEVLLDWHDFVIPSSITPGEYTVRVALVNATDGELLGETALASISIR